jgi:hypothetical protein
VYGPTNAADGEKTKLRGMKKLWIFKNRSNLRKSVFSFGWWVMAGADLL